MRCKIENISRHSLWREGKQKLETIKQSIRGYNRGQRSTKTVNKTLDKLLIKSMMGSYVQFQQTCFLPCHTKGGMVVVIKPQIPPNHAVWAGGARDHDPVLPLHHQVGSLTTWATPARSPDQLTGAPNLWSTWDSWRLQRAPEAGSVGHSFH